MLPRCIKVAVDKSTKVRIVGLPGTGSKGCLPGLSKSKNAGLTYAN